MATQHSLDTNLMRLGDRLADALQQLESTMEQQSLLGLRSLNGGSADLPAAEHTSDGPERTTAPRRSRFDEYAANDKRHEVTRRGQPLQNLLPAALGELSALRDLVRTPASPGDDRHTTLLTKQNELTQKQLDELRHIKRLVGTPATAVYAPGSSA